MRSDRFVPRTGTRRVNRRQCLMACVLATAWAAPGVLAQESSGGPEISAFVSASFDAPVLSPNGEHVAVRRVAQGRPYVEVYKIADSQSVSAFILEEGMGMARHHWGDDRTLIVQVRHGDEFWTDGNNAGGWTTFDIETRKADKLFFQTPRQPLSRRGLIGKLRVMGFSDRLVPNAFADDPNDVRVLFPDPRKSWVNRYDTRRDRYDRLADVPGEIFDAHADRQGNVLATLGHPRAASTTFKDQVQLLYRRASEEEFKVALAGHLDDFDVDIVADGPREDTVYILENTTSDTLGLSTLDLADGTITPVFRPARTDVLKTYLDAERKLYAVRYDDHFPQFHYPDPHHPAAELHRFARAGFKNMNVEIVSIARDATRAIISASADTEPGMYYLGEVGGKQFTGLFRRSSDASAAPLGTRNPVEFPGADGERLTGYITLPKDHKQGEAIPFVVLPRSELFPLPATWGYDRESQMFASLGLGVLEVNARGSMGFGRAFWQAGVGRVAYAVRRDIGAGVQYAVASGNADPDRVCIVGRRFGAYAAIMASVRRPARYACVVTINGIYDVAGIRKSLPIGGARERFAGQVASANADDAAFREISPRYIAARINTPLLIVEARQFSENLPGQAREMIRALKLAKIPHEVHEESTSRANNLLTHDARRGAYTRIAAFVLEHTKAS